MGRGVEIEEVREIQLMMECFCGIPSEDEVEEINEMQCAKVKRFLKKYGWGYGVNINLNGYHPEPVFRVQE